MIKKFPSVWEKMSENHGGGIFWLALYLLTYLLLRDVV